MVTATAIKAIETKYNGYRFRSRLEARWAVFFDSLGIKYEYEKEGFDFGQERYLPDFWLPNIGLRTTEGGGIWVEIKGEEPTAREDYVAAELVTVTDKPLVMFVWPPWEHCGEGQSQSGYQYRKDWAVPGFSGDCKDCGYYHPVDGSFGHWCGYDWDNYMVFAQCFQCNRIKVEYLESNYMVCEVCNSHADLDHPRLLKACTAAKSARFEHGERGR